MSDNLIVELIKSGHEILNCIYADGTTHIMVDELERRDPEFLQAYKEADENKLIRDNTVEYGKTYQIVLR